jgi:hypothetical protein
MATQAMRAAGVILLVVLVDACTKIRDIQQAAPARTMTFPGNHHTAAHCVQRRLDGRRTHDGTDRQVISDTMKVRLDRAVSHYAVTLGAGPEGGFAELRVVSRGMSDPTAEIDALWKTVQACAAEATLAG